VSLSLPSVEEVRAVITTALTDAQIEAIILDASLTVDQCPAVAGYDADVQAAIIKYWTADLLSMINAQGGGAITADRLGDASRSYSVANLDKGAISYYRQQAFALDPSGCLRRLGKARATVEKV
jgi:hypothetical protein